MSISDRSNESKHITGRVIVDTAGYAKYLKARKVEPFQVDAETLKGKECSKDEEETGVLDVKRKEHRLSNAEVNLNEEVWKSRPECL